MLTVNTYNPLFEKKCKKEETEELQEVRETKTAAILAEIQGCPSINKRLDSSYIADGAVGLFSGTDGNAYEIIVRPANLGKFKQLFKKYL